MGSQQQAPLAPTVTPGAARAAAILAFSVLAALCATASIACCMRLGAQGAIVGVIVAMAIPYIVSDAREALWITRRYLATRHDERARPAGFPLDNEDVFISAFRALALAANLSVALSV